MAPNPCPACPPLRRPAATMHPHGVAYLKSSEGSPYHDGTMGAPPVLPPHLPLPLLLPPLLPLLRLALLLLPRAAPLDANQLCRPAAVCRSGAPLACYVNPASLLRLPTLRLHPRRGHRRRQRGARRHLHLHLAGAQGWGRGCRACLNSCRRSRALAARELPARVSAPHRPCVQRGRCRRPRDPAPPTRPPSSGCTTRTPVSAAGSTLCCVSLAPSLPALPSSGCTTRTPASPLL